ncbi:sigma-70 family RNA polymerase sigma factor [Reichenbachiella sp.]|uniref:sigma-70 family RNA polymerase sigma factor n=1 Tax=Reichenbachiella sp. TaxID=2184521 RepID=UPI003BAE20EB
MLVLEKLTTRTREDTISQWYEKVFPKIAAYIKQRGGNLEVAKEVFQTAIVLYYEKLCGTNFQPLVSDGAYLMGISKKLWLKYQKKNALVESLDEIEITAEKDKTLSTRKLLLHLKQSGEKCMELLQSFYYEKLSMKQVADRYGYASERSATVKKYKCLEKVREGVKLKSLNYEDFFE